MGKILEGMSHGPSNLSRSMWLPLCLDDCGVNELEGGHLFSFLRDFSQREELL